MICKLELKFEGKYPYYDMLDWERFLLKESDEDKFEDIRFARLETLVLDFGSWNLGEDDKLVVRYLLIRLSLLDMTITNNCLSLDSALRLYV